MISCNHTLGSGVITIDVSHLSKIEQIHAYTFMETALNSCLESLVNYGVRCENEYIREIKGLQKELGKLNGE